MVWNGFLFVYLCSWLSGGTLFFSPVPFLIPFLLAGLGMGIRLLYWSSGCTRLWIHKRKFQLQWQFFFLKRKVQGNVNKLKKVALQTTPGYSGPSTKVCTIYVGNQTYKFGARLSDCEKEWIIQELNVFLEQSY
ncbi:hypothetical protein [Acaryochloris thomasi]|uniref:hypothetical protein n=1 Tax=Acaryochloris thomasi TaxID=2929456 RepID=UPI001F1E405B|nr:hypothetical protein [Acaryochloris thomasi]